MILTRLCGVLKRGKQSLVRPSIHDIIWLICKLFSFWLFVTNNVNLLFLLVDMIIYIPYSIQKHLLLLKEEKNKHYKSR